jgi:hypothetical protein
MVGHFGDTHLSFHYIHDGHAHRGAWGARRGALLAGASGGVLRQ